MGEYAFFLDPGEVNYYGPVIRALPPKAVDLHIGSWSKPSPEQAKQPEDLAPHLKTSFAALRDAGYRLDLADNTALEKYRQAVLSASFLRQRSWTDKSLLASMQCACLYHAVDGGGQDAGHAHWQVLAHQRQALRPAMGKVCRHSAPELFAALNALPSRYTDKYAYSGPYHLGIWEKKRHAPKTLLRAELEVALGRPLPADRPVVAFLRDEFCHLPQVENGLRSLAEHVCLIVKGIPRERLPKSAIVWPYGGYAPNVLRFAADFILAGYNSGTLASSVMLGLRCIAYHSAQVWEQGRGQGALADFTAPMPYLGCAPIRDIPYYLKNSADIEDTGALLNLLEDAPLWRRYTALLPPAQRLFFGEYRIDGAAEKTAQLLHRLFTEGDFGEDTAAVRLRPEYGNIAGLHI